MAAEHPDAAAPIVAPTDADPGAPVISPEIRARRIKLNLRDVPLRQVLDTLSREAGLVLLTDPELRTDTPVTLFVHDAPVSDVLDGLLRAQQLGLRPLDARTAIVHADTPARRRSHAELQVGRFALQHVDAAAAASMLKALLRTPMVVGETRGNLLVLRDTPDALRAAADLIAAYDRPGGHDVQVEIEVIEVSRQRLLELGLDWPTALSVSTPAAVTTLGGLRRLATDGWQFAPLALGLNMKWQDLDGRLLARPVVRARHREKASLLIGDKLPVLTAQPAVTVAVSTATAPSTTPAVPPQDGTPAAPTPGNATPVPVTPESPQAPVDGATTDTPATTTPDTGLGAAPLLLTGTVQYIDVGLKLELEPQWLGDGEIAMKIGIELSRVTQVIDTGTGVAYQVGIRQAQTSMRLREGQTQWLGGLISQRDRRQARGVPGLRDLPLLDLLFGVGQGDREDTELLLGITPRLAPAPAQPMARSVSFDRP